MPEPTPETSLHPYLDLRMGMVKQYTIRAPESEEEGWLAKGWLSIPENPVFRSRAKKGFVHVMSKPRSLSEVGIERLTGVRILGYSEYLGSYGMGGPGFFGLLLEPLAGADHSEYLVYTRWGSGNFTFLDNRMISAPHKSQDTYNPWLAFHSKDKTNELSTVVEGAIITSINLQSQACTMDLLKGDTHHVLEFVVDDPRLPQPRPGKTHKDDIETQISDYLLFQHELATLWV
jgi:hypothetical protein